jgi:uracil-DNA glycosylase
MSVQSVEEFVRLLKDSPSGAVFNPWWEVDRKNDIGPLAPRIRREQLCAYLEGRLGKARLVLIGEALGYRGGHFSGIAMTSERILLGKKKESGIEVKNPLSGMAPRRTSKPDKFPNGFSEPTATIVWSALLQLGLSSQQFVLWNAFPWHTFDPRAGMLSNRTPGRSERAAGMPALGAFLNLFPCKRIVALGRIASAQLEELGVERHCVRHPASGGARLFRRQIAQLVNKPFQPIENRSISCARR